MRAGVRDRLPDLAAQGMTQCAAAEALGVSKSRVSQIAKEMGLKFVPARRGPEPKVAYDALRACAAEGMTMAEAARAFGLSENTVRQSNAREGLGFPVRCGVSRHDLAACIDKGLSSREVAAALGVSPAYARKLASRHGLEFKVDLRERRGGEAVVRAPFAASPSLAAIFHPRWSPADDLTILRHRARGRSLHDIADRLGRPSVAVQQRWHKLRAVRGIEAAIRDHLASGADAAAPWPDPAEVAA